MTIQEIKQHLELIGPLRVNYLGRPGVVHCLGDEVHNTNLVGVFLDDLREGYTKSYVYKVVESVSQHEEADPRSAFTSNRKNLFNSKEVVPILSWVFAEDLTIGEDMNVSI